MKTQPKALYLINVVSMWEYFSYYGMRVLLVIFMTSELGFSDEQAFILYALYTTFVELGGVVGGFVADRIMGIKSAIVLGGMTIAAGHLSLAFPYSAPTFYLGLGLIIVGTCLFRPNIAALLGMCYEENDPRRESGYTLYYTGINLGAFLATLLTSFAAEKFGWHYGFGLAAAGMIFGIATFVIGSKVLPRNELFFESGKRKLCGGAAGLIGCGILAAYALYFYSAVSLLVPFVVIGAILLVGMKARKSFEGKMNQLWSLAFYLVLIIIFFSFEEQLGSSLVLFSDRHVERNTLLGLIPSASLITFNPLTILLLGPLVSRLLQRKQLGGINKMAIGMFCLGAAFILLWGSSIMAELKALVPLSPIVLSIVLIALGELFVGPTVYAKASEIAPKGQQGFVMGLVTMAFALASLFSGFVSRLMAVVNEETSLAVYTNGFFSIGSMTLTVAVLLMLMNHFRRRIETA